jgi:hypothetical protein
LGISTVRLNEILNLNVAISSIARELFKQIIPENKRSVNRWSELTEEVFIKEQMLISM